MPPAQDNGRRSTSGCQILPRRCGCRGRDGHVDHRNAVQPGVAGAVGGLVGLAELGDRGGLPGAGRAGQDQPLAGADRMPVQQRQTASGGDGLPQRRGGDHAQPGVVVQPFVVIGAAGIAAQGGVLGTGQQGRRCGRGEGEIPTRPSAHELTGS